MSIIAIGNPGRGKSTLLNCFAGDNYFESGACTRGGLTVSTNEKEIDGITYIDNPGIADQKIREEAFRGITASLRKGGYHKILFITGTTAMRPVDECIVTMQGVLDAVPEIGKNFGIIVNKLSPVEMKKFEEKPSKQKEFISIFRKV